jgi:type I restriction enzyme S subunit
MQAEDWAERKLGQILSFEYGASLPDTKRSGDGFPVYGSSGEVGRHRDFLVPGPGIIVGRKGTVGAVVWSAENFWPIDTTYYVTINGEISLRWSYWLLSALPLRRLDSSTGVPGLNRNDAYGLPIKVPPLPEQRRIAEMLDTVDAAIQQTEALIAKLKLMKAGLLHDLLTRGLDKHGQLRDPSAHPEQFKDSPLGRIPREWKVVRLATICQRITDGCHQSVPTSSTGIPFLYVSCVRDGQIFWDQAARISETTYKQISKGREPKAGLILYTAVGSYGYAALVKDDRLFSFQRHIAYVLPDESQVVPEFLTAWLNGPMCRAHADKVALGNAQKTVTLGYLANFPVPLLSVAEQSRISEVLDAQDARIRAEEAYGDKLKHLKQGLMRDLLTGRVRVPVAGG